MRRMVLVLLLVARLAEARVAFRSNQSQALRHRTSVDTSVLRVSAIAKASSTLCAALSSYGSTSGTWWCLAGDGTTPLGGAALSAVGSPVAQSVRVCPNGPDCSAMPAQGVFATGDGYTTSATQAMTGDWTACVLASAGTNAATRMLLAVGTANPMGAYQYTDGHIYWDIYSNGGGGPTELDLGASSPGAIRLACATYQRVGGVANNVFKVYLDGVLANSSSTAVLYDSNTRAWFLGRTSDNSYSPLGAHLYGAFVTESVLSATQLQNIATAVNVYAPAVLLGSRNEAFTITSTSPQACTTSDGSALTMLPAGRPCLNGDGLLVEDVTTNLMGYSEAFGSWTIPAGTTVTTDATYAPDSVLSAEMLTDSATVDMHRVYKSFSSSAVTSTWSVFLKAGTANYALLASVSYKSWASVDLSTCRVVGIGGSAYVPKARAHGVGNGWCRLAITATATATTDYLQVQMGDTQAHAESQSGYAGSGKTIYAWGAQVEQRGKASSYVRVPTNVAVNRLAQSYQLANPLTGTSFCAGATFRSYPLAHGWDDKTALGTGYAPFELGTTYNAADTESFYVDYTGGLTVDTNDGVAQKYSIGTLPWSNYGVLVACNAAGALTTYFDGVAVSLTPAGTGSGVVNPQPANMLLGKIGTNNYHLDGYLRDLCVTTSVPGCLSGIASGTSRVVWLGDSITQGNVSGEPSPPSWAQAVGGYSRSVTNAGTSGDTVGQMYTRWTSTYKGKGYNQFVLLGGVNDMIAGTSAASVWAASYLPMISEATAEGQHVVLITVLPWAGYAGSSAPKQTETLALNASITSWCAAHSNCTLVDGYALLGGAPATNLAAGYDSGDHLHPNVSGNAVLADAVIGALSP